MIKIGDLVRIKESDLGFYTSINRELIGKLAIVVVKGTWSMDVSIIGDNIGWEHRIPIEHLEVIG